MKILIPITAKDVFITVSAELDYNTSAYDSLSKCMSKRKIKSLLDKAQSNVWHWCNITVTAEFMDNNGKEYTASAYLGACSYKSRMDFIKQGDYYVDMLAEVMADINSQL